MIDLTLIMPRLGETMDEGVIVRWMVTPGESFRRGQPILEVETDKTVVEFPALGEGVIEEILAQRGAVVAVGAPVARARVASRADWSQEAAPPSCKAASPTAGPSGETAAGEHVRLRMPRLGETMEQGVVARWMIAEGDTYARGDAILEIETDKTVSEVPALAAGRLLRILAGPGETVAVGAPLAEVDGPVDDGAMPAASAAQAGRAGSATGGGDRPSTGTVPNGKGQTRATPLARRLARGRGLAINAVPGTGRRGRVEAHDVERFDRSGATRPRGAIEWLDAPAGRIAAARTGTIGCMHLLVHGFAGDRTVWAPLALALTRAGHRTLALDLPGHGETEAEADGIEPLADAVVAVLDGQAERVVLVGHSLGAAAAVLAAQRRPDKVSRLVLLTPAGCGGTIGAGFVHGMAEANTSGEIAHLLRELGSRNALSDDALSRMVAASARGRLRALAETVASRGGRQRIDILRPLAGLGGALPVRAVFGTRDRIVQASDALNLPGSVASHFLPSGHMPQWDVVSDTASIILNEASHD